MQSTVIIALCCFLGAQAYPKTTKIVGGQESELGQFPAIVSLQDSKSKTHFCGGTLISDQLILTAASCLQGNADPLNSVAYVGSNNLANGGSYYTLKSIVLHEDFSLTTLKNDIALVKTSSAIELGPNVSTLNLPKSGQDVSAGTQVTSVGWGANKFPNQQYPDVLNYLLAGVVGNSECESAVGVSVGKGQICTGGVSGSGVCFGDGGSPLILNDNTVVGVVSFTIPCASGAPDVSTRTSAYIDWISKTSAALI